MTDVKRYREASDFCTGGGAYMEECADGDYVLASDHDARVSELERRIEGMEKDAQRYRWLRSKSTYRYDGGQYALDFDNWIPVTAVPYIYDDEESEPTPPDRFDAAIDAAMKERE
jgi:hypothetical protein